MFPITASLVAVSVGILIVVFSILGAISDVKSFGFVVDFVVEVDERVEISKSVSSKMSGFAVVSKSLLSKSTSGLCVVTYDATNFFLQNKHGKLFPWKYV